MTTLPFVEGNASEYNIEEDYASEDYDSEDYSNCTEAAPDSNLVESVYYDVLPDMLIDEYVPAHAAPTIEAENAIEQSVVVEAVEADATLESEIAGKGVIIEDSANLQTPFEVGTWVAIEDSAEEAVEAITTMITIPAPTSTSLIPMWSTLAVIEETGDSTVPTHDWEAFFGCSPMVMLQECRTTLLTAVENFFIEVERFRICLRRFINSVLGKWEATS